MEMGPPEGGVASSASLQPAYGAVRTTCRSVHLSPRCLVQLSLDFIQNMRPVIVPVVLLVTVT